jgi:membrane-associated phospholipid phosphatase
MLGEFTQQTDPNGNIKWDGISLAAAPIPTGQSLTNEINELIDLIDYRPGVMAEALRQRDNMLAYWCGVLMFGAASHPWTFDLMSIALRVGQFQAMHYKRMANNGMGRPRPSQLSSALMPPIEVPGHASYPSGHATEAYLISMCLAEMLTRPPPQGMNSPPAAAALTTRYDQNDPYSTALLRLAQRVARNREVLGLHYRSDSEAGRVLAEGTFRILKQSATIQTILDNAQTEWRAPQY